jgi:hypothetical protein
MLAKMPCCRWLARISLLCALLAGSCWGWGLRAPARSAVVKPAAAARSAVRALRPNSFALGAPVAPRFRLANMQDDGEEVDMVVEEYELDAEAEASLQRSKSSRMHLRRNARFFRSVIWLSWWCQAILSTVAGVILVFSNAITDRSLRGSLATNGTLLAVMGVIASGFSLFWTWSNYMQVRKWAGRRKIDPAEAQLRIRRSLRLGVWVNLVGMFFALIGAEQIVGMLVAKLLYSQGYSPFVAGGVTAASVASQQLNAQTFRALDIFIVQANTNSVLSHFCSLVAGLGLLSKSSALVQAPSAPR